MTLMPTPSPASVRLVPLKRLGHGGRWRTEAMRSYRTSTLVWVTRGQGRITVAGVTRGYGAHNAIFIPPRTMHGFEVGPQVFGTAIFLADDIDAPLPHAPVHLRIRDVMAQTEMVTLLEALQREIETPRPFGERAIHHHIGLLSVWLDRQASLAGAAPDPTASQKLVLRFTRAVEDQLYTGQSVSDYAEALGVTPTHLSRVCRETCGRPASEILADRVSFEARRLLADTPLPVKRIAEVLGFRSAAYFTRAFQQRTGQTPTAFRTSVTGIAI